MSRQAIVKNAQWGVEHKARIHWAETRPIDGHGHPRKLDLTTDCSGFATDCFEWAGAPDPNGLGYNGLGYTGTMLKACTEVAPRAVEIGDLVVFGSYPGSHVVIVVKLGPDLLVVSHGGEYGPIEIRLSQEAAAHRGQPLTYLSALKRRKDFVPPSREELETATNPATESNAK